VADSVFDLVSGEALPLDVSAAASGGATAPDLSATPVTLILDAPAARHVFRWRPGGTSHSGFSLTGGVLSFDGLTAAFTAANLNAHGDWNLYLCVGAAATVQDAVGKVVLRVDVPPKGSLPVSDS